MFTLIYFFYKSGIFQHLIKYNVSGHTTSSDTFTPTLCQMPGSRDTNHVVASDCRGGELGILSCNTITVRTTPRRDCNTMGHYGWICNVVSKSCHASNPKRQGGQKYIYKFCTSLDDFDVNTIM